MKNDPDGSYGPLGSEAPMTNELAPVPKLDPRGHVKGTPCAFS